MAVLGLVDERKGPLADELEIADPARFQAVSPSDRRSWRMID